MSDINIMAGISQRGRVDEIRSIHMKSHVSSVYHSLG